jgi:hypothetical protein
MMGKYRIMKSTKPINPGVVMPALGQISDSPLLYSQDIFVPFRKGVLHPQKCWEDRVEDDDKSLTSEIHLCSLSSMSVWVMVFGEIETYVENE